MADFESPVLKAGSTGAAAVTLLDVSATPKLLVRSNVEQFGVAFGTSSGDVAHTLTCGMRPGEWLLVGDAQACAATAAGVEAGFTSVVDCTHSRALFRLSGASASAALEKACSIDWSNAMMPNGAVVSASVAKVSCDIVRNDMSTSGSTADPTFEATPNGTVANPDGDVADVGPADGGPADVANADGGEADVGAADGGPADVANADGEAAGLERSYLIACDRSFGQYLFDALLDATTEFAP